MKRLPTTLYKAMRRPDGRYVCVDAEYLTRTSKVVRTEGEYLLARSLGWCDGPQEAMAQLEKEEDEASTNAGIRNFDDRHLSDKAKAEADAAVSDTIRHIADIPVAPKKGRPKKPAAA
jgi:hypothetical protein